MSTATLNWPRAKYTDVFRELHSATVFICLVIGLKLADLLKTKVKVKVKVTLEQATKAQMESRGISLLFL
jgi:hypothetical protein